MKFKSAAVLIILVALLSIAASGCSSLGVALDSAYVSEQYEIKHINSEVFEGHQENIQVLPKIVTGNKYEPIYHFPLGNFKFGLDYDIIYLGYDTIQLLKNVINNNKSLSQELEYPENKSDFNLFSFIPNISLYNGGGTKNNTYLTVSYGIPLYTAIEFDNKKYYFENGYSSSAGLGFNLNSGFFSSEPASLLGFLRDAKLNAKRDDSSESIEISYSAIAILYRHYF